MPSSRKQQRGISSSNPFASQSWPQGRAETLFISQRWVHCILHSGDCGRPETLQAPSQCLLAHGCMQGPVANVMHSCRLSAVL